MAIRILFRISTYLILFGYMKAGWSASSFEVYVTANEGAFVRDVPDISGKIVQKLSYGQKIEVLEELKLATTLSLKNLPYTGEWYRVQTARCQGFIFSALVMPVFADDFQCEPAKLKENIAISERDVNIELCVDGSFYVDESYECKGACSLHGCWRQNKGLIEFSKRKQFRVKGIGKPIRCTHSCEYESYRVETAVWAMQPFTEGPVQIKDLDAAISQKKDRPANIKILPASNTCRRSYLFGKPR